MQSQLTRPTQLLAGSHLKVLGAGGSQQQAPPAPPQNVWNWPSGHSASGSSRLLQLVGSNVSSTHTSPPLQLRALPQGISALPALPPAPALAPLPPVAPEPASPAPPPAPPPAAPLAPPASGPVLSELPQAKSASGAHARNKQKWRISTASHSAAWLSASIPLGIRRRRPLGGAPCGASHRLAGWSGGSLSSAPVQGGVPYHPRAAQM